MHVYKNLQHLEHAVWPHHQTNRLFSVILNGKVSLSNLPYLWVKIEPPQEGLWTSSHVGPGSWHGFDRRPCSPGGNMGHRRPCHRFPIGELKKRWIGCSSQRAVRLPGWVKDLGTKICARNSPRWWSVTMIIRITFMTCGSSSLATYG